MTERKYKHNIGINITRWKIGWYKLAAMSTDSRVRRLDSGPGYPNVSPGPGRRVVEISTDDPGGFWKVCDRKEGWERALRNVVVL